MKLKPWKEHLRNTTDMASRHAGLCCLLLGISCLLLCSCVPAGGKSPALPRAHPGYVQWLERQSLLAAVPQYTLLVSGTELLWKQSPASPHQPSADQHLNLLLEAADTWFFVQSQSLITENLRPVLAELSAPGILRQLGNMGIRALYLMPTGESGSLWGDSEGSEKRQPSLTGEDVTSLSFAPHVGTEAHYTALARLAAQEQWQLGASLLPAATGLGPDFFLAARHVRDYPGIMAMVEIPKEAWPLLPPAPPVHERWTGIALKDEHAPAFSALVAKQLLPPAMLRDAWPWATTGGWAATGIIQGIDGAERRFVYRYHDNPQRPILQWDDPARGAQKILSANVIRVIGSQQQSLAGLHLEALAGLDVDTSVSKDVDTSVSKDVNTSVSKIPPPPMLEPAASALKALAREIRRYGGWSLQADVFPPHWTQAVLDSGVDFTVDSISSPGAEYALLTGDAQTLKAALAASLNTDSTTGQIPIDQRRLMRSLPGYKGLDLRPLLATTKGRAALENLQAHIQKNTAHAWGNVLPDGNILYATAATLSAMAAHIPPEMATKPEATAHILKGHVLLTLFKGGLPGLLFLSGHDLTGALNLAPPTADAQPMAQSMGAWAISPAATALYTRNGLARAPVAYPPLLAQMAVEGSYAQHVAALTTLRTRWGISRGTLLSMPETGHHSTIALLTRLPDGKHLLTVANFSPKEQSETLRLPESVSGQTTVDGLASLPHGKAQGLSLSGHSLRVELDPWQCRLIRIE